jgi:large subunit ribosomal protein L25
MERVSLNGVTRAAVGKNAVKKVRKDGLVPAILYGRDRESLPIAVAQKDLLGALSAGGRNVLIDLRIAQNGQELSDTVMIVDLQRDNLRRQILHVDLQKISLTELLEANVPVTLVGIPEGVASGGGILEFHLREVEVRCLPTQIPDHLAVNVEALGLGASLHVSDLPVPDGVEVLTPPEEVIVTVVAPRAEEEPVAAVEAAPEPEVVGRVAPAEGEAKAEGTTRAEAKGGEKAAKPEKKE